MPPIQTVEVVRLTYGCFVVSAFDIFGRKMKERQFSRGRNRRQWAIEQARQWADKYYLQFDGTVTD